MKDELQLEDFKLAIIALWRRKILIIFVTIFTTLIGLLLTVNSYDTMTYSATSSVYSATYGSYKLTATDVSTMVNYSDVVSSRKVCEYAASLIAETSVTANEIQNMINMSVSENSYVIKIFANHTNPELVIKVVNAVAEAFVEEISSITGNESIRILDEADSAYSYQANLVNKKRMLFAGGGFVMICGFIVLKSLLSHQVQSIVQCVEDEDEILGIIPDMN